MAYMVSMAAKRSAKTSLLDMRFQYALKALRKSLGLTQEQLAEKLDLGNANYISQLETGAIGYSSEQVERFAKYFGVDPGDFFAGAAVVDRIARERNARRGQS